MIERKISNGTVTLIVKESIVAAVAHRLKDEMQTLLAGDYSQFIVDFSQVQSIDSSGVGVLIAAQNGLSKKNAKLSVINVSEPIMKMFQIMRLDKHFNVQAKN